MKWISWISVHPRWVKSLRGKKKVLIFSKILCLESQLRARERAGCWWVFCSEKCCLLWDRAGAYWMMRGETDEACWAALLGVAELTDGINRLPPTHMNTCAHPGQPHTNEGNTPCLCGHKHGSCSLLICQLLICTHCEMLIQVWPERISGHGEMHSQIFWESTLVMEERAGA